MCTFARCARSHDVHVRTMCTFARCARSHDVHVRTMCKFAPCAPSHHVHPRTMCTLAPCAPLCTQRTMCTLSRRDMHLDHFEVEHVVAERVHGDLDARLQLRARNLAV